MKAARYDEASEGRMTTVAAAFRELLQSRMLWGAGSLAILGVMGGFIFFNGQTTGPLQNQPDPPAETSTIQQPADTVTTTTFNEEAPVAIVDTPENNAVLGTTVACDEAAYQAALTLRDAELQAEAESYATKGSGGLRLLLTGRRGAPSAHETQAHQAAIEVINERFKANAQASNCDI